MERTISNIQQPQIFNIEKIVSYLSLYKDNLEQLYAWDASFKKLVGYMAAFFRQVKIGVLTLTLEKKQ